MHSEKAKDMQNQCFVLSIELQTMGSIYRQGKIPVWRGMQTAAIFSSSLSRPSTSKQSAKLNATTSETLCWLWERDASYCFLLSAAFLCPLHRDSGLPAPVGGCIIFCHVEETLGNHSKSAKSPELSPLGIHTWLWGKRRKSKDLGVAESQEKS